MNKTISKVKLWIKPACEVDVQPPLGMSLPSAYAAGAILLSLALAAPQHALSFLN